MHPDRPRLHPTAARLAGAGALAAAALAAAVPIAAAERDRPATIAQVTARPALRQRDGGVISGRVEAIDYQRGVVRIAIDGRTLVITVLPSTNIEGPGNGYHTLADLARGSRVQIFTSLTAGRYVAQIIRLR